MSIIQFRRAKLLQDAKLSGVAEVADIARAMATMDGAQALSRFDDGFTSTYFNKAEALLDLAIECALERHRGD